METDISRSFKFVSRRKMICVAKRVQRPLSRGNTITRETELGQAFQDGTFAARLIPGDNKLGKTDVFTDIAGEELIDFFQQARIGQHGAGPRFRFSLGHHGPDACSMEIDENK